MWTVTLRDLQFRRRRFAIGAIGAGLVFAMALTLAGMAEGFRAEARRTVLAVGADRWVMPVGAGPFTSFSAITTDTLDAVGDVPGVERADPLIVLRHAVEIGGEPKDVVMIGHAISGLGEPVPTEGETAAESGQMVPDERLGLTAGDSAEIGGKRFTVTGTVRDFTMAAGIPVVYVPIEDARALAFDGQPLASAIVTTGVPEDAPPGFVVLENEAGIADALRPLANGVKSLDNSTLFLWVVAAIIIGTIVYLTTLERLRDFAVLKAIGASSRTLFAGLALQAIVVAMVAAGLASIVAFLLVPLFPLPVEIPARAFAILPVVAVVVGLLASLSGLRRAIAVDPARAFGGPEG